MELTAGLVFSREFHWSQMWKHSITWRGVTCWKCPLDLWSYQQILAATRPQAIVEAGVAMGGSALFLADVCELLGGGQVYGIERDVTMFDPRAAAHPRIELITGDTCDPGVHARIAAAVRGLRTMVILDSDHDTPHVLAELRQYADLVTPSCYLICEDGILDRPDGPSVAGYAGPAAAIEAFLAERQDFRPQRECVLGATFNPEGYLLRVV
jgi:cephalosporin hydroxylase